MRPARRSVLPGFGLSLGFTLTYLALVVLIPLSGLFLKTATADLDAILKTITDPRVVAAYKVSFGLSLAAAAVNTVLGLLVAWVLVRYRFPGRKIFDALVDIPFALPTAVAGIALTALYTSNGWMGQWLTKIGVQVAFTPVGIALALVFVGLPFTVRMVEPVLQDLERAVEEASASLGASRWQTFRLVLLPYLYPSLLTGFAMAFARGLGEYGSVIFIAGNMPYVSEIVPLIITIKLEQYDYVGATAIALTMLAASFILLFIINVLQKWSHQR